MNFQELSAQINNASPNDVMALAERLIEEYDDYDKDFVKEWAMEAAIVRAGASAIDA